MLKVLFVFLPAILPAFAEEIPLRTPEAVRSLSREESAKGLQVEIEGTVIFVNPNGRGIIVHDGTASCWIGATPPFPDDLKPGSRVRATGRTNPDSYFPNLADAKVVVIGQENLPEPCQVIRRDLFLPSIDSQWIGIEAVVVGTEAGGHNFTLVVDIGGSTFKADVPLQADTAERVAALMQRRVKLSGVVGTVRSEIYQMTGRHFFIPSFDQIIPIEGNVRERTSPPEKIAALLQIDHAPNEVTRVTGVVTQRAAGGFYLRDETASTFVHASGNAVHPPGSLVEVEGLAAVAPFRPMLRAAKVRRLGKSVMPEPLRLDPAFGIRPNLQNERVVIDCEFLAQLEAPQETVLQCRSGDRYFETWLLGPTRYEKNLRSYDKLRLTGIYEVTTTHPMPRTEWADGFRIHLVGPEAVVILQSAPWWTSDAPTLPPRSPGLRQRPAQSRPARKRSARGHAGGPERTGPGSNCRL